MGEVKKSISRRAVIDFLVHKRTVPLEHLLLYYDKKSKQRCNKFCFRTPYCDSTLIVIILAQKYLIIFCPTEQFELIQFC
jgi:hypothetical protein